MDKKNVKTIECKDADGNDICILVKKPTAQQISKASIETMHIFSESIHNGAMPREAINDYMLENGLWDADKEKKLAEIDKQIFEAERQFKRGGRTADGEKFTKKDGFDLAMKVRRLRAERSALQAKRNELDSYSVQSQIENAKMDHLVAACTFWADKTEDGQPVKFFESLDDYKTKQNDEATVKAMTSLMEIIYGIELDSWKQYPENKFLVEYGFAREEDCALINEDGHLVDEQGRLIDDQARFIRYTENGEVEYIDSEGNLVDEDGKPIEEFVPFDE